MCQIFRRFRISKKKFFFHGHVTMGQYGEKMVFNKYSQNRAQNDRSD